jgi:hypothetical protein
MRTQALVLAYLLLAAALLCHCHSIAASPASDKLVNGGQSLLCSINSRIRTESWPVSLSTMFRKFTIDQCSHMFLLVRFAGTIELRRPLIGSATANQSAAQQLPTEPGNGIGHRLRLSSFPSLSEVTSPLARDRAFVEQGIVLDHFLVFLVVFVVCIFR